MVNNTTSFQKAIDASQLDNELFKTGDKYQLKGTMIFNNLDKADEFDKYSISLENVKVLTGKHKNGKPITDLTPMQTVIDKIEASKTTKGNGDYPERHYLPLAAKQKEYITVADTSGKFKHSDLKHVTEYWHKHLNINNDVNIHLAADQEITVAVTIVPVKDKHGNIQEHNLACYLYGLFLDVANPTLSNNDEWFSDGEGTADFDSDLPTDNDTEADDTKEQASATETTPVESRPIDMNDDDLPF